MTDQQPDYTKCWANCLGDCDGPMSQEHIVSKCLYGEQVKVKGLPWCKDDWKHLSIDNVTSRVLCKSHNERLSPVDDGAEHTLKTISDAFALWFKRKKVLTSRWTVKHYRTDMLLLERWCLKTLINTNLNLKPGWPVKGDSPTPTDELVRIVYGLERFERPKGLYLIVMDDREQRTIDLMEGEISIQVHTVENRLNAATFEMWGLRYLLNLYPHEVQVNGGKLLGRTGMKYQFQTHDERQRTVLSHVLKFDY